MNFQFRDILFFCICEAYEKDLMTFDLDHFAMCDVELLIGCCIAPYPFNLSRLVGQCLRRFFVEPDELNEGPRIYYLTFIPQLLHVLSELFFSMIELGLIPNWKVCLLWQAHLGHQISKLAVQIKEIVISLVHLPLPVLVLDIEGVKIDKAKFFDFWDVYGQGMR
jgi:hypothetical protein